MLKSLISIPFFIVIIFQYCIATSATISLGNKYYIFGPAVETATTSYCHGDFNKIIITSTEGTDSYEIIFSALSPTPIQANGSRSGNTLIVTASAHGYNFSYNFNIFNNDENIKGRITITGGGNTYIFNEWGARGSCPTVSLSGGLPEFIANDFVNLSADIQDISLFRSSAGHDYSDSFEQCRSMKHYFSPPVSKRFNNTVPVYSPVTGRIVHLQTEEDIVDDGKTNQQVVIRPDNQPAILIVMFHIDLLATSLVPGTQITAGQQHGYGRFIWTDGM